MNESGKADLAEGAVERIRQLSAANYQLLVMLEVVREWSFTDAADLTAAARQVEVASLALTGIPNPIQQDVLSDTLARAHKQLSETGQKLDRVSYFAPLRSEDPAAVSALIEALRQLRAANEASRTALSVIKPVDGA